MTPVEMIIIPRTSDIGGFEVKRALPFRDRRMVGPFIFWDQMGPGEFLTGQGMDVRPHPHIGLSTVTYLLDGEIDHRDSLGSFQTIRPGDVNLMLAGQGIVHSERTGPEARRTGSRIFGIQSWLAQPLSTEHNAPAFMHTGHNDLPMFSDAGINGRVIMGAFEGQRSPVKAEWDTLYLDVRLAAGANLKIPAITEERALYALSGTIRIHDIAYEPMQMLVLQPGEDVVVAAEDDVCLMVLGGAVMDAPRFIYWNFVASSRERLEEAKADWKNQRFARVPGDESEFIPLPE